LDQNIIREEDTTKMMIKMMKETTIVTPIEEDKDAKGVKEEIPTLDKTLKELRKMTKMEEILEMIAMSKMISEINDNHRGVNLSIVKVVSKTKIKRADMVKNSKKKEITKEDYKVGTMKVAQDLKRTEVIPMKMSKTTISLNILTLKKTIGLLKDLIVKINMDLNKDKMVILNKDFLKVNGVILQLMILTSMVHTLPLTVHILVLMEPMFKMEITHGLVTDYNKLMP
jgi:hypothetical protein